jgi:hypothetical protein
MSLVAWCALSTLLAVPADTLVRSLARPGSPVPARRDPAAAASPEIPSPEAPGADDSALTDVARLASARSDHLVGAYAVLESATVAATIDRASFWLTDGEGPERLLVVVAAPVESGVTPGQRVCIQGIVLHIPRFAA